jgi:hypothetical protein
MNVPAEKYEVFSYTNEAKNLVHTWDFVALLKHLTFHFFEISGL